MAKMPLEQSNWEKLLQLVPTILEIKEHRKLTAPGFMDLGIDILEVHSTHRIIALSHHYKHPSGDMIPDPDIQIRLFPSECRIEAMTYQDMYSYQEVYTEEGACNPRLKNDLDEFLSFWLNNLIQQGFPEEAA